MSFSILVCMAARQDQQYAPLCGHYTKLIRPHASLVLADAKEAQAEKSLRARWPKDAFAVALSPEGKTLTSEQFAVFLGKTRQSARPLIFLIGAAAGLSAAIKAQCQQVMSLSALTLPHQLCQVVLLEQIYRGFSILQGHPYHK